jgi:hypothetical protein
MAEVGAVSVRYVRKKHIVLTFKRCVTSGIGIKIQMMKEVTSNGITRKD